MTNFQDYEYLTIKLAMAQLNDDEEHDDIVLQATESVLNMLSQKEYKRLCKELKCPDERN